ncbi:nucleoside triphosphate pyrophosphohydrolase [Aureimonas flava]|uniref:Nucleoside triphosphate pyrophosphohydrolase n=1 Tax=Aureimonas flava TaxID=2320271 RepID=A0A3A1WP20_9HYPH|nr:nucleoside triphosphate pyrophosphohydrolase [Aureimonas flava]RIY01603.1 nucleoside triphosphate pyrophosphohydrolase [Aureimonas flava]
MQPSRDIARLVEIMAALRQPETGCPWDVEQNFDSIVPYTIEETYEVVDAIERRDAPDLREELGDLLLQVVYYAQMASEIGLFTFDDVVEGITAKMIRRHPHVFGDVEPRSARSAKGQWERIKAEEKRERREARERMRSAADAPAEAGEWMPATDAGGSGLLDAVPGALPALMLSRKIQEKAATVGFDWTEPGPILAKLREETGEFESAAATDDRDAQEAELGDILFTVVNLARRHEIDPDAALRRTVAKFRARFAAMEARAAADGRSLADMDLEDQESLWQQAKGAENRSAE